MVKEKIKEVIKSQVDGLFKKYVGEKNAKLLQSLYQVQARIKELIASKTIGIILTILGGLSCFSGVLLTILTITKVLELASMAFVLVWIILIIAGAIMLISTYMSNKKKQKEREELEQQEKELLAPILLNNVEAYEHLDIKALCESIFVFKNSKGDNEAVQISTKGINDSSNTVFHLNKIDTNASLSSAIVFKFDGINMCLSIYNNISNPRYSSDYVDSDGKPVSLDGKTKRKVYKLLEPHEAPATGSSATLSAIISKFEDLTFSTYRNNNSVARITKFYNSHTKISHLDYQQFEKDFLIERDNEIKFRVLFTPLVQEQLVRVYKEKDPFFLDKTEKNLLDVIFKKQNDEYIYISEYISPQLTEEELISSLTETFTNLHDMLEKYIEILICFDSIKKQMFQVKEELIKKDDTLNSVELESFLNNRLNNDYLFSTKDDNTADLSAIGGSLKKSFSFVKDEEKEKVWKILPKFLDVGAIYEPGLLKVSKIEEDVFRIHTNFFHVEHVQIPKKGSNTFSGGYRSPGFNHSTNYGNNSYGINNNYTNSYSAPSYKPPNYGAGYVSSYTSPSYNSNINNYNNNFNEQQQEYEEKINVTVYSQQFHCTSISSVKDFDTFFRISTLDNVFAFIQKSNIYDFFPIGDKVYAISDSVKQLKSFAKVVQP